MKILKYTLKPTSPWITALRSDTLHGLIVCQVREWEGEKACKELLESFLENKPAFTCSSAFPQGFLPHPVLPPILRSHFKGQYANTNHALIDALQIYKQYKKIGYIPCDMWQKLKGKLKSKHIFQEYCNNPWPIVKKENEEKLEIKHGTEPHNTISRNMQTTIEGGLFFHEVNYSNDLLDVYVQAEDHVKFAEYLGKLGEVGFGADSTVGKGRFKIVGEADDKTADFQAKGSHYMSLSVLSSEDLGNIEGYYKLFTKKGKTWVGKSSLSPFKKPFLALEEGAIIKNLPKSGVLKNIHPDSDIIQMCHALALPCTMEN